jgi:hypothetical protein
MFRLKCHQPNEPKPKFYIQSKGEHSGRPLKKAIPNCFSVYTDSEILFSLVYALFVGGKFKHLIGGSVVPFIRLDDAKNLIRDNLIYQSNTNLFLKVEKIDEVKENLKQQLILLDQMQRALCNQALKAK